MKNNKKLLMVFSVAPFPLRENGTSLRYLPIIRRLNERFELDIIIINANGNNIEGLREYCSSYTIIDRPKKGKFALLEKLRMNVYRFFPWTCPYSFEYYGAKKVKNKIISAVDKEYDAVIWVQNYLTFVPDIQKALKIKKVIVDFIDSPYLLMQRQLTQGGRVKLSQHYELWKMKRWERKIQADADRAIYISAIDAVAAGELEHGNNVTVIPNGVSIDDYTDETDINYDGKIIGYLGNMSYGPNVEAVIWMVKNILTKTVDESIKLVVIGKSPAKSILALAEDPRVIVTGMVEDVWAYVNAVDIFVLPIFSGAGLKNKVLELMYAGKPVITTEIGNEGIYAVDGEHVFICETAEEFQQRIELLFDDERLSAEMGVKSREFVSSNFDWQAIINKYNLVVDKCL